jgi:hypothetical protein
VDFTCAPSRRKPITVALGEWLGAALHVHRIDALPDLGAFERLLAGAGPWLGAFDFPFGLPRAFVESLGLGHDARTVIGTLRQRCPRRMDFRALIDDWGNARPAGARLIHRATDLALGGARSTSPLQTRYVPVGFMYYEGFARVAAAGVEVPGLSAGDPQRVALEGYPGALAQELIGARSYKNDASAPRRNARGEIVAALNCGRTRLQQPLHLPRRLQRLLVDDTTGDHLDAVLCLVQAAWASTQPRFGLPARVDAVEGWIVTAVAGSSNP